MDGQLGWTERRACEDRQPSQGDGSGMGTASVGRRPKRQNHEDPQRLRRVGLNEIISPGWTRHTHSNSDPIEVQEVSGQDSGNGVVFRSLFRQVTVRTGPLDWSFGSTREGRGKEVRGAEGHLGVSWAHWSLQSQGYYGPRGSRLGSLPHVTGFCASPWVAGLDIRYRFTKMPAWEAG